MADKDSLKMNNNSSIEKFVRENAIMIVQEKPNRNRAKTYKCKDCNKEYDNFQALGGHCASHRRFKSKIPGDYSSPSELVLHACKICKKEFENGQSLGGHMRKHYCQKRVNNNNNNNARSVTVATDCLSSSSSSNSVSIARLIGSKDFSAKVVLEYDLNLTPVENEKAIREMSL